MGMDFAPPISPRPSVVFDAAKYLTTLQEPSAWVGFGEAELGVFNLSSISCEVGTLKFIFEHPDNNATTFTVWIPQKFSWTGTYVQHPYCRCELVFPKLKPRPCFKVKVTLSEGEDDLGTALIEGKAISDETKSALTLKASFKASKEKAASTIKKDTLYESAPNFDERELLDVSFKAIPEKVKTCLDRWDDVNVKNEAEETPLHKAVMNGSQEVIMMLVERGGDPRLSDKFGQTPVDIAEKYFKKDLVHLLRTYQ